MSDTKRDYEIGYGKTPSGRPFEKGQSGNPRGKSLPALLVAALNEKVYITIHGKQREITKREAIVKQMVNQSASAELRATKMLIDMIKEISRRPQARRRPSRTPEQGRLAGRMRRDPIRSRAPLVSIDIRLLRQPNSIDLL